MKTEQSKATLSREEREKLVVDHVELPTIIACQILKKYPGARIEREELAGEGALALVRAGQTYEPDGGASFSHYASIWIRKFELKRLGTTYMVQLTRADRRRVAAEINEGYDPSLSWYELDATTPDGQPLIQLPSQDEEEMRRERAQHYLRDMLEAILVDMVNHLDKIEKEVLRAALGLGYDHPLSWAAAARVLHIPERTLYRIKDRALATIGAQLREKHRELLEALDLVDESDDKDKDDK